MLEKVFPLKPQQCGLVVSNSSGNLAVCYISKQFTAVSSFYIFSLDGVQRKYEFVRWKKNLLYPRIVWCVYRLAASDCTEVYCYCQRFQVSTFHFHPEKLTVSEGMRVRQRADVHPVELIVMRDVPFYDYGLARSAWLMLRSINAWFRKSESQSSD